MYITNYRYDLRYKILIQFETSDKNGKRYTIDNIPDDILIKEFNNYFLDNSDFYFRKDHPNDFYPITSTFEERCSKLNFSYFKYTKDHKEGYLCVYNCRELLYKCKCKCLYIPGNHITINDIIDSYYNVIASEFYPIKMFVKPLTDEVKNYLKLNNK